MNRLALSGSWNNRPRTLKNNKLIIIIIIIMIIIVVVLVIIVIVVIIVIMLPDELFVWTRELFRTKEYPVSISVLSIYVRITM
jgi:flagellar basal body-associated protein FliL